MKNPDEEGSTKSIDLINAGDVVENRFIVVSSLFLQKIIIFIRFFIFQIRKIKSGGFGQVYEARDKMNRDAAVALKLEDRNLTPVLGHEVEVLSKMRGKTPFTDFSEIRYKIFDIFQDSLTSPKCTRAEKWKIGTITSPCNFWEGIYPKCVVNLR